MSEKEKLEDERTTLWVSKKTRDKIHSLRIIPEEHVDSVLQRLIKVYEENKE